MYKLSNKENIDESTIENEEIVETSDLILSELEEERTESTKTFALENENFLVTQYPFSVHFKDQNGDFTDYDNTLSETLLKIDADDGKATADEVSSETVFSQNTSNDKEIKVFKTVKSDKDISFNEKTGENGLVYFSDDEYTVSWKYEDAGVSSGHLEKDNTRYEGNEAYTVLDKLVGRIKYENVYDNIDIECLSLPYGVKENIIIKRKTEKNKFVINYDIGDLSAKQENDKEIAITDKNGEEKYVISAPFVYDSDDHVSKDVFLTIIDCKDGILKTELSISDQFLNNSDVKYPVTVDPSFVTGQEWGDVQCTFITDGSPNIAYGYGSTSGYTGTVYTGTDMNASKNRSLIKMNSLPSLNPGDMIIDVTVNLYSYNNDFYDDVYIGIYEANSNWNQSTVTWNNQPGMSDTLIDYEMITPVNTDWWHEWNITKLVKKWYNASSSNKGFFLKMINENSCDQCAGFYSSNYPLYDGIRPAFVLTYRNNKGIEDYWTYTDFNAGSAGTAYVNDYSGALTFTTGMLSTGHPTFPVNIVYSYNS